MLNIDQLIGKLYGECPELKEVAPNKDDIFAEKTENRFTDLESANKSMLEEIAQLKADMAKMSAVQNSEV